jgi:hypothetical protein
VSPAKCDLCERRRKIVGTNPEIGMGDDVCQECYDDRAISAAEELADRLRDILATASASIRDEIKHPFEDVLS